MNERLLITSCGIGFMMLAAFAYFQGNAEKKDKAEMAAQNCVLTQEMRPIKATETGISSKGDLIFTDVQRLEFKYNCDDYPRWRQQ